nr:hypothetical protein [Candidatus Sigynarchaeota archaeon]
MDYAARVVQVSTEFKISVHDAAYVGLGGTIKAGVVTGDKKLVEKLGTKFKDRVHFLDDFDLKRYVEAPQEDKDS